MTISAKIVADSVAPNGARITTMELDYPRMIHSEMMTHRLLSRNAASSRAIPVKKQIALIDEEFAHPIHWGRNEPGMKANAELEQPELLWVQSFWEMAKEDAVYWAEQMDARGAHKQIVNRVMEPFAHIKVVVTATEWDNFFWLRDHADAQPEVRELARVMREVMLYSVPVALNEGDWHTPYFGEGYWLKGSETSLEDALAISSSCCAQTSYRLTDDSLDKAKSIMAKLIESEPVHASPVEHQATPIGGGGFQQVGVTHVDRDGSFWSGNFKGFVQHRQLIPGHTKWKL